MQGTCVSDTGCRGARLLVWLILNDRVQPSLIAGVLAENYQIETMYSVVLVSNRMAANENVFLSRVLIIDQKFSWVLLSELEKKKYLVRCHLV